MIKLLPYLRLAVDQKASDLYFTADAPAMLRVEGVMRAVGREPMSAETVRNLVMSILTPEQQESFDKNHDLDLATAAGGLGRFRVNVYQQRGVVAMVMRYIPNEVPKLESLHLPETLAELALLKRGLVLLVGPTGSGKSTTMAAMINHRNEKASGHILSIEDPIEYVHANHRAIISQREVGLDTESYERALVSAMREAPDVIYIGEIRRQATMDACLQLANTGHLVLSTLHSNNSTQAVQRIVNFYPQDHRDQLYVDLSMTLRAIVSQRLVPGVEGGRVPAVEVLINSPYVSELIRSSRIDEIPETLAKGEGRGMQAFDEAIYRLYKDGVISRQEALANADSRTSLDARINFGG